MSPQSLPSNQEELREAFKAFLKHEGIKLTRARTQILEKVLELNKHFEAEELLYALKDSGINVGKATVYRTLPLLVECGILKKVQFDVKQAYYERVFGEEPHDHMVCRSCGRIIEFTSKELVQLRRRIAGLHGFQVSAHRFQITGTCRDCHE